jgi:hypothetical protein
MRGVTDISGLRDIRSMHSTRRSIPRFKNSAFLDLYLLQKEKERLEKEAALLAKRSQGIQKRLSDIQRQTESLERSAQSDRPDNGGEKAAEPNSPAKRKWKTFALNY